MPFWRGRSAGSGTWVCSTWCPNLRHVLNRNAINILRTRQIYTFWAVVQNELARLCGSGDGYHYKEPLSIARTLNYRQSFFSTDILLRSMWDQLRLGDNRLIHGSLSRHSLLCTHFASNLMWLPSILSSFFCLTPSPRNSLDLRKFGSRWMCGSFSGQLFRNTGRRCAGRTRCAVRARSQCGWLPRRSSSLLRGISLRVLIYVWDQLWAFLISFGFAINAFGAVAGLACV